MQLLTLVMVPAITWQPYLLMADRKERSLYDSFNVEITGNRGDSSSRFFYALI